MDMTVEIGNPFCDLHDTHMVMLCRPTNKMLIARGIYSASCTDGADSLYPVLVLDECFDTLDFFVKVLSDSFGRGKIIYRETRIGKQVGLVRAAKSIGSNQRMLVFDPDDILVGVPNDSSSNVHLTGIYTIEKNGGSEWHNLRKAAPPSARSYNTSFIIDNEMQICEMERNEDDFLTYKAFKEGSLSRSFNMCSIQICDRVSGEHHKKEAAISGEMLNYVNEEFYRSSNNQFWID